MWRSPCTNSSEGWTPGVEIHGGRFNLAAPPSPGFEALMVDSAALESILKEIEHREGVQEAMLVSLAGTYLAGSFPKGVHVDTFGSMFAVLIGSAETVTSEMKDALENVVIHSKQSDYLIVHGGRKALLVMRLPTGANPQKIAAAVEKYIPRIDEHL